MILEIKSILRSILDDVKSTSDLTQAQSVITTRVVNSKVNDVDKRKILLSVAQCRTYTQLLKYVYNSLLKYEGEGLIK